MRTWFASMLYRDIRNNPLRKVTEKQNKGNDSLICLQAYGIQIIWCILPLDFCINPQLSHINCKHRWHVMTTLQRYVFQLLIHRLENVPASTHTWTTSIINAAHDHDELWTSCLRLIRGGKKTQSKDFFLTLKSPSNVPPLQVPLIVLLLGDKRKKTRLASQELDGFFSHAPVKLLCFVPVLSGVSRRQSGRCANKTVSCILEPWQNFQRKDNFTCKSPMAAFPTTVKDMKMHTIRLYISVFDYIGNWEACRLSPFGEHLSIPL